ncbi:MAG: transcription-repair coupling factor [Chloroflexi bacterium]|nr:transcription-repair coupling factor [Chloroflexota bacterium]
MMADSSSVASTGGVQTPVGFNKPTLQLAGLLPVLQDIRAFRSLCAQISQGQMPQHPLGILAAARSYVAAAFGQTLHRPIVLLTARPETARLLVEQLQVWLGAEAGRVYHFAPPEALPYERVAWSRETRQARLAVLTALAQLNKPGLPAPAAPPIVVSPVRALVQQCPSLPTFQRYLRRLHLHDIIDLQELMTRWLRAGYRRESVVGEAGVFSLRGGIIDIWPPNAALPVRIELWGNEVDSIRRFDPSTQRSISGAMLDHVLVAPGSEAILDRGRQAAAAVQALDTSSCHPPAQFDLERDSDHLASGTAFRGMEFYIPYLSHRPTSILDYLPDSALLLIDAAADVAATALDLEGQAKQIKDDLCKRGDLPPAFAASSLPWQSLRSQIEAREPIVLGQGKLDGHSTSVGSPLGRMFHPGPRWGGQLKRVLQKTQVQAQAQNRVVLVTRQAARLADLYQEQFAADGRSQPAPTVQHELVQAPAAGSISLIQGQFDEGWRLTNQSQSLDLLTDAEVFGWGKARRRRSRPRPAAPESLFADIHPGDYVVHIEHGIGRFMGLTKIDVNGVERDYLHVEYAQSDKLYVPVHQADRLARYVGPRDASPQLHRLGTAEWSQVKARAKRAVADIAEDLLALYAQREAQSGYAFSPDSEWQQELEASFPYIETEDQLVAIEAVKEDMERAHPMDRLICGDVGYGKTEVALRAAFKAIVDGRQVAVLVPTTILAQQHFKTFQERLRAFPVEVHMLSRFRTRKQQQATLDGLALGTVDVVIGTHRLLSKDVEFKNLGLLIIDEEQRFGVRHKERIKQYRSQIDVLTLTATPIPRTLYMSLTGVRDLSTIDTPPEERLPVHTFVQFYDETLIRNAILRELDRNGQVFFVHNRVRGIEQIANRIRKLVPEATVVVGHGQMPERKLEKTMLAFAAGEFDVLVCTTIIESGLDIPNANTILINRGDTFGLAQLYQLRGRVGRGAQRAYAYLLYDKNKPLSSEARQRLDAIQEASELGAGFRIAMRDLEIRGAGELLGARQHGHIAAVGFDLYVRLLAQAVEELRDEGKLPTGAFDAGVLAEPLGPTVQLDLPLEAGLPHDYVTDDALRLQLYRRVASLNTPGELDDMMQELEDRFGSLPEPARQLLFQVKVKMLSARAGVRAIGRDRDQLVVRSAALKKLNAQRLQHQLGTSARVGTDALWIAIDEQGAWRQHLLQSLDILSAGA